MVVQSSQTYAGTHQPARQFALSFTAGGLKQLDGERVSTQAEVTYEGRGSVPGWALDCLGFRKRGHDECL